MGRPLAITERQMRAIIRAARKEGLPCEVKFGDAVIRISHDLHRENLPPDPDPIDDEPEGHL